MTGSSNETVSALYKTFARPEISAEALTSLRTTLQVFVDKHKDPGDTPSKKVQEELRRVYQEHVERDVKKLEPFLVSLTILQPYLRIAGDLPTWFDFVVSTAVDLQASRKDLIQSTQDFVLGCVVVDQEAVDVTERQKTSLLLTARLVEEYLVRTQSLSEGRSTVDLRLQNRSQQTLQELISAVGQKRPQDLFDSFEKPLLQSTTRYHTLQLMASWLKHQHAHIYRIIHTAVIEILLKCLMNDRSTAMISVALQCLLMLLPHIPVTVSKSLPRLFLIYSRCLCWEKFSSSASQAQKDLVTDERRRQDSDDEAENGFSIDPDWQVVLSVPDAPDSSAPELLTYFTYLYGLYPLNFLEYIKKPRKYLKQIDFPGADDFDLDQDIIHKRTEQFQHAHLLHPNLFRLTVQDELENIRWFKAEPSEVVAECLGLYIGDQPLPRVAVDPADHTSMASPQVESEIVSSATFPAVPTKQVGKEGLSPQAPGLESLTASKISASTESIASKPTTGSNDDITYLERELLVLRSELDFERHMKQQHVSAIGQMKRDRIKAVTVEAETGSLLNSNKTLQKKLSEAMAFNEKLQRETQSRKTHVRQSEDLLNNKIRSLRANLTDQTALKTSLAKANEDIETLRQLVVESEARELSARADIAALSDQSKQLGELNGEVERLREQLRLLRQDSITASPPGQEGKGQDDNASPTVLNGHEGVHTSTVESQSQHQRKTPEAQNSGT